LRGEGGERRYREPDEGRLRTLRIVDRPLTRLAWLGDLSPHGGEVRKKKRVETAESQFS